MFHALLRDWMVFIKLEALKLVTLILVIMYFFHLLVYILNLIFVAEAHK